MDQHEYIIVTQNTPELRTALNGHSAELVASQETFICWRWLNPPAEQLAAVQALPGYVGTAQLS